MKDVFDSAELRLTRKSDDQFAMNLPLALTTYVELSTRPIKSMEITRSEALRRGCRSSAAGSPFRQARGSRCVPYTDSAVCSDGRRVVDKRTTRYRSV
jgi:hypothetical protein